MKIAEENSKFKIFNNDNKGLGGAINLGITMSNGDYIAIMMADLSDDIEDNYNLTMKTVCHRCEYTGPTDRFLVDRWPVDRKVLLESIEDGRLINQIQLTFSDRRSIY